MPYVVIADDLTGAADAGAPFARSFRRTYLALHQPALDAARGPYPAADVLVVSTESRHLPSGLAYARTVTAAAGLGYANLVYKKIDSTLRGNPGVELRAVMDVLGVSQALVAPAFPGQGRTTIGGRQYVNGLPLEQTSFVDEVATSDVAAVLSRAVAQPMLLPLDVVRSQAALHTALQRPGIQIADAETDDDLAALAQGALACGLRLLCGSAGLSRALAGALAPRACCGMPLQPQQAQGPVLVVAGSRHPRTRCQVFAAARRGATLIAPDARVIADQAAFGSVVDAADASLAAGRHTLLSIVDMADVAAGGPVVASTLARVVLALSARRRIGALVLTGGDIAIAVLQALGAQGVWLNGEVESGIPWGVLHEGVLPGIPVVTKAGGFGNDDILAEAIEFLSR